MYLLKASDLCFAVFYPAGTYFRVLRTARPEGTPDRPPLNYSIRPYFFRISAVGGHLELHKTEFLFPSLAVSALDLAEAEETAVATPRLFWIGGNS